MNKSRILLIDKDLSVLEDLKTLLENAGYVVSSCKDSGAAVEHALYFSPHIIILEIELDGKDGVELCVEFKKMQRLKPGIVFYTNRDEDYSQIAAFDAGADDFLIKPLNPRILLKRLGGLLKRLHPKFQTGENADKLGDLLINRDKYTLHKKGVKINLPRKEFELLCLLASTPGKVFSRQEILSDVWGYPFEPKNRTIDVHIRKLRKKIGDNYILTVKGIGYRLEQNLQE